jgi:DNA invertase Pin-like site-specific DNA recombinase
MEPGMSSHDAGSLAAQISTTVTRAAVYGRVSTKDKGQNPEMQLAELREYCQRRGWTVTGEYVDVGVSGSKASRPQLDRLMRDVRLRRVDVIAVWKLDRFGRSLRHLVDALGELKAVGVAFVSLRDNLDLSTPAGRMLFHVVGAMAEFERDLISERVRAGMGAAKKKGSCIGRPRVMADARKVAALRAQGLSWKQICSELALSKGTAQRAFNSLPKKVVNTAAASE